MALDDDVTACYNVVELRHTTSKNWTNVLTQNDRVTAPHIRQMTNSFFFFFFVIIFIYLKASRFRSDFESTTKKKNERKTFVER